MQEIGVGTIVQLKSGGPKMTCVEGHGERIVCQWFAGGNLKRGIFPDSSLIIVNESESDKKK